MSQSQAQQHDVRQWVGKRLRKFPEAPPYDDDLEVTPKSTFGMMVWRFSKESLPPGSQKKRNMNFLGRSKIGKNWENLQEADELLLTQLKEFMVAYIFNRSTITFKVKKVHSAKASQITGIHAKARRLFVGLRHLGLSSLSQLTQEYADEVLELLSPAPSQHESLSLIFLELKAFSQNGLISDSNYPTITIKSLRVATDKAKEAGAPALSDKALSEILKISRVYIDKAEEIMSLVDDFRQRRASRAFTESRLRMITPFKGRFFGSFLISKVLTLIQIAGYNFIGWHLGARISEVLSLKRGFAIPIAGSTLLQLHSVEMTNETFKAVSDSGGEKRVFEVHPYLARVCAVLEAVANFAGATEESLFVGYKYKTLLSSDNVNLKLQKFLIEHEIGDSISTHSWRNTLVAVTVRSVKDALGPLCQILGHKTINTTIGYAFSNPFVRADLRKSLNELVEGESDRFLMGARFFGGEGYSGKQGVALETGIAEMHRQGKTPDEIRTTLKSEMRDRVMFPTPIAEGIDCTKPGLAKGLCTKGRGDLLADGSNCKAECPFRAESVAARSALRKDILAIPTDFTKAGVTPLMKMQRAADIGDRLKSWPDLLADLKEIMREHQGFATYFEEVTNGR